MFYKCLKVFLTSTLIPLFRVKIIGRENVYSLNEKLILYSNHYSFLDPIFMHMLVRPKIRIMAKKELFSIPVLKWVIKALGAFPVDREAKDVSSVKTAIQLLNEGNIFGIFPEGTRSRTGELLPFHPGTALIALRANALVAPVYISRPLRPFRKTYIVVGKPVSLSEELTERGYRPKDFSAAAKLMEESVLKLKAQISADPKLTCQK